MDRGNDGGHNALAGFLFQILGSASLAAELLESPSDGDGSTNVIFAVVNLESHGQDAELVSTAEGSQQTHQLVQFKYSGAPVTHPIEPHDLIDVLEGFRESEATANKIKMLPTTFRLVRTGRLPRPPRKSLTLAGTTGHANS